MIEDFFFCSALFPREISCSLGGLLCEQSPNTFTVIFMFEGVQNMHLKSVRRARLNRVEDERIGALNTLDRGL